MANLIADVCAYFIAAVMLSSCHVLVWRIWHDRPPVAYDDQRRRWRPARDIQTERGWHT